MPSTLAFCLFSNSIMGGKQFKHLSAVASVAASIRSLSHCSAGDRIAVTAGWSFAAVSTAGVAIVELEDRSCDFRDGCGAQMSHLCPREDVLRRPQTPFLLAVSRLARNLHQTPYRYAPSQEHSRVQQS